EQAERHYRDGLAITQQLADSDPTNTEAQRDLSVAYNKIGDLLARRGESEQAERHYRDGLAIAQQLADSDPTNTEAQRDLSVSYTKIGDVLPPAGGERR